MRGRIGVVGLVFFMGIGCAAQTMYNWGRYEDALHVYYKSPRTPQDHQQYMAQLADLIEQSEHKSLAVPPGIYAEYGFGLYRTERYQEALQYFEQEKSRWPEAVPLMDRIMVSVRKLIEEKNTTSQAVEPSTQHTGPQEQ